MFDVGDRDEVIPAYQKIVNIFRYAFQEVSDPVFFRHIKNLRHEAYGKCTAAAFHRKVLTLVRARPHRFLRRRASPSHGAVPFLLLDPSPTGSALRANPFPKVTDPFCRLPLPTLVYRLEAFHLGELLWMWAQSSTKITLPLSDFQGTTGAHRTAQEPHCSTEPPSLSQGRPTPGTRSSYREKKTLLGAPIGVSELVCVAALEMFLAVQIVD
ncbi:hypothetical protein HPB51_020269 [Rhipicephalus microplus]|uniref:Uncharacterized protein n=1 Tax=Rhipicephalus microplus TaxID=6941 RepID=A0A9J6EUS2_RHIMP|nr:hypothetical protein HPB51_020269 [Rhipicephalus microplus]